MEIDFKANATDRFKTVENVFYLDPRVDFENNRRVEGEAKVGD
jgi:hypothetical protein